MTTFGTMYARVVSELRRSNMTTEAKQAINDAISEGAKTRFYFNEMRAATFNTVIGTEYYADQGLVQIDAAYYTQSSTRYNLDVQSKLVADNRASGNVISGRPDVISRSGVELRLEPVPNLVVPVYLDGFGKLTPWPLVADADTNNWMTYGERYIRTLAKAILLKEVIRDYGEATALEAMAEDYKQQLLGETVDRLGTGVITPTQW